MYVRTDIMLLPFLCTRKKTNIVQTPSHISNVMQNALCRVPKHADLIMSQSLGVVIGRPLYNAPALLMLLCPTMSSLASSFQVRSR